MTETDPLAAFVAARLDEDEAAAREGQPDPGDPQTGEWTAYGHPPGPEDRRQDRKVQMVGTETEETGWMVCTVGQWDRAAMIGAHIARHDPARVLREVAGKRKILAEHEAVARLAGLTGQELGFLGWYREWVLKNLAAAWSDHPDYQEAWKP